MHARKSVPQPADPSYRLIALTKGYSTKVSPLDFEWLNQWNWCVRDGQKVYATREDENGIRLRLHRVILNAPKGIEVDHINGDSLDNQRGNLRLATIHQNRQNRGKDRDNTSGFKGVVWHPKCRKWRAVIAANGKVLHLGLFLQKEDAALAYNVAAIELHGEFAWLNQIY